MPHQYDYVLSHEGPGALLLDGAGASFSDAVQEKIWRIATELARLDGVLETVPGMNNLMIVFDPLAADDPELAVAIAALWEQSDMVLSPSRIIDVPVIYGGEEGIDLAEFAQAKAMSVDEVVRRHTAPLYSVAAVGAMPGFVYLSGLDPALATPRRADPRNGVPKGSVIIGGTQAGIMPVTAPSGWHILGWTRLDLFDPQRSRPAYFKPGDRIRFVPESRG